MDERYLETLQFIAKFQQHYAYSPSLKDISDELGITEAGISLRIQRLIENGLLERVGNRALRITGKGYKIIDQSNTGNKRDKSA